MLKSNTHQITLSLSLYVFLCLNLLKTNKTLKNVSLHDQSDTRSLSDSLDNIPSSVFGPEGIVTRFTLPLSYGRKDARHKRQGYELFISFFIYIYLRFVFSSRTPEFKRFSKK